MLSDSEHKMSVVVLFGGMSSEHEVSRVSAGTFVDQLDRQRYELLTIGITKEGRWLYTEADSADGRRQLGRVAGQYACVLSPDRADHGLILFTPAGRWRRSTWTWSSPCSTACGARTAPCRACWSWPASPMWAAAFWPARSAWTRQSPTPCSTLRHPSHQVALRHPLGDRV